MKLHTFFAFLILTASAALHGAAGQGFSDPYYLIDKTFALDPSLKPGTSSYRISTFLPHHTLIFTDPKKVTVTIGGEANVSVITESGERLIIPQRWISTKTFKAVYKDLTIAFHEDSFLCPEDERDCKGATGIDIPKGSVFSIAENSGGFIKLSGTIDGTNVTGYLTAARFDRLRSEVVLTDTSLPHPRLVVDRVTKLESLGTNCGEIKKSISEHSLKADAEASAEPGDAIKFLTRLSGIINLNVKLSTEAEFKRTGSVEASYGEQGISLQFFKVDITALDQSARIDPNNPKRVLIIETTALCVGSGPTAFPAVIKEISVREDAQGGVTAILSFKDFYRSAIKSSDHLDQNDPAFQVFQLDGNQAFLTSITTAASYSRIRRVWEKQVQDGSIAAILMGMFNATCPRKQVAGRVAIQVCDDALEPQESTE
ncbi:MAG TPA: hypothetical protein VKI44_26840 [Acetobacteraceae bacterium]|nr:hypothetical protein [Acetobacteraceae bacterium]